MIDVAQFPLMRWAGALTLAAAVRGSKDESSDPRLPDTEVPLLSESADDQRSRVAMAVIGRSLSHHAITRCNNVSISRRPTLSLEHLLNGTLAALIPPTGQPTTWWGDTRRAITIVGIAEGIRALHCHGLVYDNLRPSAIGFTDDFRPCLSDLSSVRAAGNNERGGSDEWTAIEVLSGELPILPAADIYLLAIVLFQIVTQGPPFLTSGPELLRRICEGERPKGDVIPDFLSTLLDKCWSADPMARPSSRICC